MNTNNPNNLPKSQKGSSSNKSTTADDDEAIIGQRFSVATFREKTKKTMDISTIKTSLDLAALKAADPFMYYSIPGVKDSALLGRRVDLSTIAAASVGSIHPVVKRLSKISFEKVDIEMTPDMMTELEESMPAEELFMSFFGDL
jgi:hypothetical protein